MDPAIVALVTAGVTALVTYLAPRLARKTRTQIDDKIVEYVRNNLPWIVAEIEKRLKAEKAGRPRPLTRDHR